MPSALLLVACALTATPDRITITINDPGLLEGGGRAGRMLLLFKACGSRAEGDPIDGPFFEDPQPMASMRVARMPDSGRLEFVPEATFGGATEGLEGCYWVQAVFDRDTQRSRHIVPGNLASAPVRVELTPGEDAIGLDLSQRLEEAPLPEGIIWFERPSAILSEALGRSVSQRAGVVLPRSYGRPGTEERRWPAVYVIPGFGGDHRDAEEIADLIRMDLAGRILPDVVWIVLDPEGPFGHHSFADSVRNGPRAKALAEEFVPQLEERFRLEPDAAHRILTGHSSGGWSAIWLALDRPETFGAAWASSPDPVDFSAFQVTDLYAEPNLFVDGDGKERPSYREPVGPTRDRVGMTNREEIGMERVLDPAGRSGQQWDAWAAVFGTRRLCDPETGAIDPAALREWAAYDIARRVLGDWDRNEPIMRRRVHVLCGDRDTYYLDRAVARLRQRMAERASAEAQAGRGAYEGSGYIEILPGLDHSSIVPIATARFFMEMDAYLKGLGTP